ncbi:MAG: DUF4294 domain-containing protein [Muribaculaceae bacterium]|nr:DUF4294 domain-containing protein [Muribaculaceae bacterium]
MIDKLLNYILPLMVLLCIPLSGVAQDPSAAIPSEEEIEAGGGRIKPLRGYNFIINDEGEEELMLYLAEITVFPPAKFKNKKEEEFYWKTVRDVRKTLPYAKLICETLIETYEYIETFPTQKEREDHLKKMEGAVFEQYKPILKKFTKSQAQMLVKLINRETNQSSYNILKAFLGSFRAGFWQTFGRFFGVNLKTSYEPESNRKDAIIERVATLVEQGRL